MADKNSRAVNIRQKGYAAARRDAPADVAGWCNPKSRHGGKDGIGAPGHGPVALFGQDDEYVAAFDGKTVVVTRFADIGKSSEKTRLSRVKLEFEVVKARPGGAGTPLLIYVLDSRGAVWSVDFSSYADCPTVNGLAKSPRCRHLAQDLKAPLRDIVVLRHQLVLQQPRRGRGYDLHSLDKRSGRVSLLGSVELEPDITALDPQRTDILLGRHKGELRLMLFGEASAAGTVEVHSFDESRVTAAGLIDSTYLLLARKGGMINKVDLRGTLPNAAVRAADPLLRICYVLRQLLKRCGCDCSCKGAPGGERPGDDKPAEDRPCDERHSAHLSFTTSKLYRAGQHIVAVDQGATRMAVLDNRLNLLFERKLDRAGAEVHGGHPHTQRLLIHLQRKHQLEAWALADYVRDLVARLPDDVGSRLPVPMPSVTYRGPRQQRAELNPTLKVCLFPVIEPGQNYADADMTKLVDQVSAKIFTKVDNYYHENSFGELAIDFTIFGHDFGGIRKPLVLPRAMASYWYEGFRAGGLTVVMPADWADPVIFDGTEALEIQANPRAGAVKTYDFSFAALWSSANFSSFPVNIDFDGSESVELTVETQDGAAHALTVNFPAFNLTLDQGGNIAGFLDDLGTYITDAIRTAEATVPGGATLLQDVRFRRGRTSADDTQFGWLQGRFACEPAAPADVVQKGRVSVTGPGMLAPVLSTLGISSAAVSGVMTSTFRVTSYLRECLRAAQVDAGEGIGGSGAYFSTSVSINEDVMAQEVTVGVSLTADFGGNAASIEVLSASGLGGTGWDLAVAAPGSESDPNNSHALRDAIELADDTFTAAMEHIRATTAWDRSMVEAMFADYDVMMIAHVGAPHPAIPLAEQWNADDPVDFGSKRMYKRTYHATDLNPPGGEAPVQMGTSNITGQRFNAFSGADLNNQAGVMAHELGHALGLPDLYPANGYRDDVMYISPWGMMGGSNATFHHFCGWSKWALGWISDNADPELNRTIFVDLPLPDEVAVTEAWLVPVEYWDDMLRDDVRDEVGGAVPIGQLMKLNLGSDGGVTAFLELRAAGSNFSQSLSPQPTVIATNGLDPASDRYWAVNGLYRRSVHLLNTGTELQAINDTWDFATAPEFPLKGCTVEVADTRTVRGTIPVYRVRVEREQAEYIDLHFQDHVPGYKSPDIWVDWTGDNPDPNLPREYPVGTPTDQGETVRFPASGTEKHFVVARVHNAGNVRAEDVKVRWFVCDPPGAGDDGRWVNRGTQTIAEIGPGAHEITPFEWQVDASTNVHQCMRMEIIDWTIPAEVDPSTGDTVALGSDDVKLQNNNAQQNVFDFEALTGSPYGPIHFPMQVHNDRLRTEVAALVPKGLPYGSKLTISPREWRIPSGEARVFHCTLELDEDIIRPGCNNDSGFLLTAWRRGGEADEIWGSCFYHIRPRFKTRIELLRGSWFHGRVMIYGHVQALTDEPLNLNEDMPLYVRIRLLPDGKGDMVRWRTVQMQSNGSFELDTQIAEAKFMVAQAWFDRSDRLGSSVSNELELKQSFLE
ncbi:hypothetical protein [Rheinheimera sp.]|uniref:hypothetical protein n=1 Tax=Rheinheimera sp. TaxID=1869214 RepID=UPI002735ABF1|nr:hypothetical protein [Rheinheimera sp.]MDP2716591.1 hypothetical protein [Rheinheimera sp.]